MRVAHSFIQGKGFAFVQFVIPEDAGKALEQLDRHAFHGRLLHIMPARRQPGSSGAEMFGKAGRSVDGLFVPIELLILSSLLSYIGFDFV